MLRRFIAVLLHLLIAWPAIAQSTQPATTSPSRESSPVQKWFDELDNKSADVRDEAKLQLMNIARSRLTELQHIVAESKSVSPAQVVALRQIVLQVYLAGEPYPVDSGSDRPGFLGVHPNVISVPEPEAGKENDPAAALASQPRIMIESRMPGFAGYPLLHDGDVIEGMRDRDGNSVLPRDINDFTDVLQAFRAGRTIEFDVVRDGKRLRVPVKLSVRPARALMESTQQSSDFFSQREEAAKDYWDANFGKALAKKSN